MQLLIFFRSCAEGHQRAGRALRLHPRRSSQAGSLRKILDQNPTDPSDCAAIDRDHGGMNRQPAMTAQDACETLRWIQRARGHIRELERDPRQGEWMDIAAEIRREVQASEQWLTDWHGGRVRQGCAPGQGRWAQ
jgi:hypothetical protein